MNATAHCYFCGRIFSSLQGVKAHLKTCTNYQNKKSPLRLPYREPKGLPKEVPAKPITRSVTTKITQKHTPFQDDAVYFDNDLQKEKYWHEQEELLRRQKEEQEHRRRQEEAEAGRKRQEESELRKQKGELESMGRKRREIMQEVKRSVIDWYISFNVIPSEVKAQAVLEIERVLGTLPVLELPRRELIQIAEGIREKLYAPFKSFSFNTEAYKNKKGEVKDMAKTRLFSGIYWCPSCEAEYELDLVSKDKLVCDDCGGRLEELPEEEE